ncbi:MAG: GGDEF domain-containing protein [Lachnospiraceae bacterium]|nr:GGDEF domain-containing protein [Lachnospiraceae bacterium]
MDKRSVTEYKTVPGKYVAYFGRASLKNGYAFVNGDEAFYHFIGKNSCYTMLELLHPDDVEGFIEAMDTLSQKRECMILRMKDAENEYKLLYVEMWQNGSFYEGFPSIDLEFCSFMELKDKYITYTNIIKKYREFMGLSENMFFEYTYRTDILKIYKYENLVSIPVLTCRLDEKYHEIIASDEFSGKNKGEFQVLYDFLKKGMDRFSAAFDAELLLDGARGCLTFRGSSLYDNSVRVMSIGVINHTGNKREHKSYYLTDNAFDPGTGIWNKRAIHEYAVEKTLEGKNLYLAIMDVDDFKKVNDTYGHLFGDEVLSRLSETIKSVIDSRGAVGRFGGDEFMIVLDGVADEEMLRRILKTASKNLQWTYKDYADSVPITTSCGVAKFPDDGMNFEEIFKKADKALYIAKAKGKNRFIIYDEAKHGNVVTERESDNIVGMKAIASDGKKADAMSEVVIDLHKNGSLALQDAMEKIRTYFDVDGVTVYQGEDLHRVLTAGKYINPIQALDFILNETYLGLFDQQGVCKVGNIEKLKNSQKDAHKLYELQECKEFVQFMAYRNGKPMAVVEFDYFNRTPKIGATDKGLMTIAGRMMAEAACDFV